MTVPVIGATVPARDFEAQAWSWVAHLRQAGTTPWAEWVGADHAAPAPRGPWLPGAAELEFVRRLASRTATKGSAYTAVADLALDRTGPGRGLAQLRLLWPEAATGTRIGPPPVDPANVPDHELVRVGTGVLAELLLREEVPPPVPPRRRLWARSFRLAGAPLTVAAIRAEAASAGRVEGGRRPVVIVLAKPLDELMAQVWSRRVQAGAHVRWPTFVNKWAHLDALPPSADLPAITRHWAGRTGAGRVHVVVSTDDAVLRRTAGEVLRMGALGPTVPPEFARLTPAGTDLVRRLNVVLDAKVDPERRRAAIRHLVPLMGSGRGPGPTVPPRQRDWLRSRAHQMVEQLRGGAYTVHGDLAAIASPSPVGRTPHTELGLVLDACLRTAGAGTSGGERR